MRVAFIAARPAERTTQHSRHDTSPFVRTAIFILERNRYPPQALKYDERQPVCGRDSMIARFPDEL